MPYFKYMFIEFFGAIGSGTREDPGSDYGFFCVINAESETQALEWGLKVHSDFVVCRTMFTDFPGDGELYREGSIEGELDITKLLENDPNHAVCSVGEFPNWIEPWKNCLMEGTRLPSVPWVPPCAG